MNKLDKVGRNALAIKPDTEKYLFNIQLIYTSLRTPDIWDVFFNLISQYSASLTKKRNTGKVFLPPEIIQDKVTSITSKFMEKYYKSNSYKIEASFAGVINNKVFEALYSTKNDDINISLNSLISDSEKDLETTKGSKMTSFLLWEDPYEKCAVGNVADEILKVYTGLINKVKEAMTEVDRSPQSIIKVSLASRLFLLHKLLGSKSVNCEKKLFKDLALSTRDRTALRMVRTELFKEFS